MAGKISSILIANRGEIALRIIRACRELGIKSIAIYSDEDARSVHVRRADEAYHIGPAAASESYLNIDKIIEFTNRVGADAIHPGTVFYPKMKSLQRYVKRMASYSLGRKARQWKLQETK